MDETAYSLVNLHLCPDCMLRLGHINQQHIADAGVTWTRTGNPHQHGFNASTCRYRIGGDGAVLHLLATRADHDEATTRVQVVDLDNLRGSRTGAARSGFDLSTRQPDMPAQIDLR